MADNIVLIGYRGTGKSSVASVLARELDREIRRTDEEIEKRAGKISVIVTQYGWRHFRALEKQVLRDLNVEQAIIDCGGGIIEDPDNIARLKALGTVFWLKAETETIRTRIHDDTNRPSLSGDTSFLDEIETVCQRRRPLYRQAADHTIATDDKTPAEIAREIIRILKPAESSYI